MVKVIQYKSIFILLGSVILVLAGCEGNPDQIHGTEAPLETPTVKPLPMETILIEEHKKETESAAVEEEDEGVAMESEENLYANVVSIAVNGQSNQYQFSVGVSSPDTGCEQYADWWEVLSEHGSLIYRRILLHSHVNDQPFTRSGGPVDIGPNTTVFIRAHMNISGYGGMIMGGSVASGFHVVEISPNFSPEIENTLPLPDGCNF